MRIEQTVWIVVMLIISLSVALAKDPHKAPNNSWISLSGIVTTPGVSSFEMDYGEGNVTVEIDDWGWYKEDDPILEGDRVTVYGYVDRNEFEKTSIEASSVFVRDINHRYYADSDDDEDVLATSENRSTIDNGLQLRGEITAVDGRKFTIDTGNRTVKIDTTEMFYNPIDEKGYQKIEVGDYVQVSGELNSNVSKKVELTAQSVTTLVKNKNKRFNEDISMENHHEVTDG